MAAREYSSSLTGAGLRQHEYKQVVYLAEQDLTDQEIRKKVFDENIFQEKASSTTRSFPYILRRARVLDETLRSWVLEEASDFVKLINFYSILKTDQLFFEFMNEVIKEKLANGDFTYEKKDINVFFNTKAEQDQKLASWSESTIERLKSSYNRLLLELGYLDNLKSTKLNKIYIDEKLKEHLIKKEKSSLC